MERVLCGANSYEQKYYFNSEEFGNLPQSIKEELQIMCVMFTEEAGGILTVVFLDDGTLALRTMADEFDYYYDEIEAGIQVRRYQKEKRELFEGLELYYRTFFSGEGI